MVKRKHIHCNIFKWDLMREMTIRDNFANVLWLLNFCFLADFRSFSDISLSNLTD